MGYKVLGDVRDVYQGYEARQGLEGPYAFPNGQVLYYDSHEGQYWDPRTDFYVSHDEAARLQNLIFDAIRG